MTPAILVALLLVALTFGAPPAASAQGARRAPKPAPAAQAPTAAPRDAGAPRDAAAPRDVAVPREGRAPRDVEPRSTPRSETTRGDGRRAAPAEVTASDVHDDQEAQRRGAVRRPSSDGARGQAPRDRAVARTAPPPRDWDRDRERVYYYPSYYSYGRYYDPYDPYYSGGLHLGYLAYSPWGWTPAFYGYPYGSGYGYGSYSNRDYGFGALKIKVKPRDAEVYVDGYFAGNVDDFDGVFQRLKLETGGYQIEIRKHGFETLQFDVHVQPDRTITYRGEMQVTP